PLRPLWHATAIGFMANNLLPVRAGEFARAYAASRQLPVRFSTALASVGVERMFDGLMLVSLMAVALASSAFPRQADIGRTSASAITTTAAAFFGIVLLVAVLVVHRPAPWLGLLGRVRGRDAGDAGAVRYRRDARRELRAGLSREHLPADHAARAVLAVATAVASRGAAQGERDGRLSRGIPPGPRAHVGAREAQPLSPHPRAGVGRLSPDRDGVRAARARRRADCVADPGRRCAHRRRA